MTATPTHHELCGVECDDDDDDDDNGGKQVDELTRSNNHGDSDGGQSSGFYNFIFLKNLIFYALL